MSDPEKYARPGLYLDEDDHGRLLAENREAYLRERAAALSREIEALNQALEVAPPSTHEAIGRKIRENKAELTELRKSR